VPRDLVPSFDEIVIERDQHRPVEHRRNLPYRSAFRATPFPVALLLSALIKTCSMMFLPTI
jgi:hypothetical protein